MNSSFSIVHLVPTLALSSGGLAYAAAGLASAQARHYGGAVHLVHGTSPGSRTLLPDELVRLHAAGFPWHTGLPALRHKLKQLLDGQRAVLHIHGLWHPHNPVAARIAVSAGVPYVVSTHGMLEPWALQHRPLRKRIARMIYQDRLLHGAHCLMATADPELQNIRGLGFEGPAVTIPIGVETDIPMLNRSSPLLPRTALFLSRIHPKKGLVNALNAWAELRPADWILRIVGPSEQGHRAELERLVRRLSLDGVVSFHDAVSGAEKYQFFHDADVFLLPSFSENFGIVVPEALACGVPVLTTDGTPWSDLPRVGCGWYIETGAQPLVEALRAIFLTPPADLSAMGARGRLWAREEFDWSRIARQSLATYRWIVGDDPRPAV